MSLSVCLCLFVSVFVCLSLSICLSLCLTKKGNARGFNIFVNPVGHLILKSRYASCLALFKREKSFAKSYTGQRASRYFNLLVGSALFHRRLPPPWPSGQGVHLERWRLGDQDLPSLLLLFVGCLTSQQHARVSQGRICSDNCTCCHTEIEVADPTLHLTQSQYTDTEPTRPSTDPISPGAWQGSRANF